MARRLSLDRDGVSSIPDDNPLATSRQGSGVVRVEARRLSLEYREASSFPDDRPPDTPRLGSGVTATEARWLNLECDLSPSFSDEQPLDAFWLCSDAEATDVRWLSLRGSRHEHPEASSPEWSCAEVCLWRWAGTEASSEASSVLRRDDRLREPGGDGCSSASSGGGTQAIGSAMLLGGTAMGRASQALGKLRTVDRLLPRSGSLGRSPRSTNVRPLGSGQ